METFRLENTELQVDLKPFLTDKPGESIQIRE